MFFSIFIYESTNLYIESVWTENIYHMGNFITTSSFKNFHAVSF